MAVNSTTNSANDNAPGGNSGIRRWLLGTNVGLATIMVIAIIVFAQILAYNSRLRADMTSSGINSLSEPTENLLKSIKQNIRLTSLYFETDREDEDQSRYRRAVSDLIELYAANNRARITAEWINPLKEREKLNALIKRISESESFKSGIAQYRERVEAYTKSDGGIGPRIDILIDNELNQIQALTISQDEATQQAVGPIEMLLGRWQEELSATRKAIDREVMAATPQYTGSVEALKALYRGLSKALKDIKAHSERVVANGTAISPAAAEFLNGTGTRYTELIDMMTTELEIADALESPDIDDLLAKIGPTANAIVIETDDDAEVVDFAAVWPAMDPSQSAANFFNRAFKGEEKVTSAILRATHKEQTAAVFVRYGGAPLTTGGMLPGQQRGAYMVMKQHLEDANFVVKEWDLKTSDTAPEIDPAPTRVIYVVLKPTAAPRDPMGRPSQEPPFTDRHKDLVLNALGDNGRAIFINGWHPGPFGPIPATYEYAEYLDKTWGISVDSSSLLLSTVSTAPGKFSANPRSFYFVSDPQTGDHEIVSGPQQKFLLPWCVPLNLSENAPEGVTRHRLLEHPKSDTLWGVKDITAYEKQLQEKQFMNRIEGDLMERFLLAAAAEKGESKVVVVASRQFAEDAVAFARELAYGSQGLQIRTRNPGNVTLLVNALHWLNDNTEFLNIGRPVDLAVLTVDKSSTVNVVQALTIVVWPAFALVAGLAAWWIRRR